MPANLTNLTESGIDLADKYLANTDASLIESYLTEAGLEFANSGGAWVWGNNANGRLGLGDLTHRSSPVQLGSFTNWKNASLNQHVGIINNNGQLWMFGRNDVGQLGLGDTTYRSSPVQVGSLTNWKQVACGDRHTVAIKTDGTIWAWGFNPEGQLGLGDRTNRSSPVQVGTLTNWKQVSLTMTRGGSSLAVKTDGTLWTWGKNAYGQLGLGDIAHRSSPAQVGSLTNWKYVSGGDSTNFALKTDGTIWNFGYLIGSGTFISSPVQVGSLTDWKSIAASSYAQILAIKNDGSLWAWGFNNNGGLGLGDTTTRSSPVQVGTLTNWKQVSPGSGFTLAVKTDGTLWSWGRNNIGQLASNNTTYRSSPVQVGTLTNWKQVFAGGSANSLAIKG